MYIGYTSMPKDEYCENIDKEIFFSKFKKSTRKIIKAISTEGGEWKFKTIYKGFLTKKGVKIKKQKYLEELKPDLNVNRSFVSKEAQKQDRKKYYDNNKEQIRQRSKIYRKKVKDYKDECKRLMNIEI
jgi:hypothetical protein